MGELPQQKQVKYVIKDDQGNYAHGSSMVYDKESKQYRYLYSEFVTNGLHTYSSSKDAEDGLGYLQELARVIGSTKVFRVSEIDLIEVMVAESKIGVLEFPVCCEILIQKKEQAIA